MLTLKLIVLLAFIASWLYSRPSRNATVSDVFVLALLAILLPYFLLNPSGQSRFYEQSFSNETVWRSEIGLLSAFGLGTIVFLAKAMFGARTTRERIQIDDRSANRLATFSIALAIGIFACLWASAEFRDFRWATTRFALGDLSGAAYRELRGVTFSNSILLDGLLGRLRYALFPLLFAVSLLTFFRYHKNMIAVLFALIFFSSLPMSLSKLPIVLYGGYFSTAVVASRNGVTFNRLIFAAIAALAVIVAIMSGLYALQYRDAVFGGTLNPILLSIERIWGEPYSVILRYFAVYPDMAPFTGVSGINLLARLSGVTPRLPDIEVARLALGPDSGSNPGVFMLGGYAAYGYAGLALFSLMGFGVVWLLDEIEGQLRTDLAHQVFMTIMPINCLFLVQVALQTSLFSYGVGIVPIAILCIDRYLSSVSIGRSKRSSEAQNL